MSNTPLSNSENSLWSLCLHRGPLAQFIFIKWQPEWFSKIFICHHHHNHCCRHHPCGGWGGIHGACVEVRRQCWGASSLSIFSWVSGSTWGSQTCVANAFTCWATSLARQHALLGGIKLGLFLCSISLVTSCLSQAMSQSLSSSPSLTWSVYLTSLTPWMLSPLSFCGYQTLLTPGCWALLKHSPSRFLHYVVPNIFQIHPNNS